MTCACVREIQLWKMFLQLLEAYRNIFHESRCGGDFLRGSTGENCRRELESESFHEWNASFKHFSCDSSASVVSADGESHAVQKVIDVIMIGNGK